MASSRNPEVFKLGLSSKPLPLSLREAARRYFQWLMRFHQFNAFYSQLPPCEPADFSRMILEAMRVRVEFTGQPVDTVPATGPLIVIANHPFGLVEGLVLDAMLLSRRPDVALMAYHLLSSIPEYQDRWIFVDPLRGRGSLKLNVWAWRQAFQLLVRSGALAVFPAGRVAHFHWRRMSVTDPPWNPDIVALARKADASILPVYFHGRNGLRFQLVGMLCPPLLNFILLDESVHTHGRLLRATVGRLIQPEELSRFTTDEDAIGFLRRETELLARS